MSNQNMPANFNKKPIKNIEDADKKELIIYCCEILEQLYYITKNKDLEVLSHIIAMARDEAWLMKNNKV